MTKKVNLKSEDNFIKDEIYNTINSTDLIIDYVYINGEDKYINGLYDYFLTTDINLLKIYNYIYFYLRNNKYINKYFDLLFLLSERYDIYMLNIEQFQFTNETIKKLCNFIKLNKVEILNLNIYETSIEDIILLAESIKDNISINKLILDTDKLDNNSLNILIESLKYNDYINELEIEFDTSLNNYKYLFYISELLKYNHNIHNLIIKHIFENNELVYLSEILKSSSIQYLKLYNCEIDDKQFNIFYDSLKNNKTLIKLDLSWNKLTNKSYLKILEILKDNDKLINLNLSGNKNKNIILFTEKLKEIMKYNNTLQVLKLGGEFFQKRINHIDSINNLSELLQNNNSLKKIKLPSYIINNKKYIEILSKIINIKPELNFYY